MVSRMADRELICLVALVLILAFSVACEKRDFPISYANDEMGSIVEIKDRFARVDSTDWLYTYNFDSPVTYSGIEAVKRRALQLASISWTPKQGSIPSRYGVYSPNALYTGIPYSLAIKTDTHVGTQVSLYTFITAVDNPGSVMYTEDLREAPYNGFDCAPYYGSTCSNSIMYAFGIDPPYYTYMIPGIHGVKCPNEQSYSDVEPCDILLKKGHVVMVYDVKRAMDNSLDRVSLFETTSFDGKDTWIRELSSEAFQSWWRDGNYKRYQYSFLDDVTYSPSSLVPLDGETGVKYYHPLDICTYKGDCTTYWEGQDVKITIAAEGYKTISVFKDDVLLTEKDICYPETVLSGLSRGLYKVRCSDADGYFGSHFTRFEVISESVSAVKDDMIRFYFSSDCSTPCYICICDERHNPYKYYMLSEGDRARGYFEIPVIQGSRSSHYKVFYKGVYNTISTELKAF